MSYNFFIPVDQTTSASGKSSRDSRLGWLGWLGLVPVLGLLLLLAFVLYKKCCKVKVYIIILHRVSFNLAAE